MNSSMIIKVLLLAFLGLFLLSCAAGTITDYKAKSPQEEGVKAALIALETAWNKHNEEAVLAILDDDFILWAWSGGSRTIVFRKGTFGFKLRDILIDYRYLSLGEPDITVKDGEATAHVAMTIDARAHRGIFRLVNRDGQWLILEWEWL